MENDGLDRVALMDILAGLIAHNAEINDLHGHDRGRHYRDGETNALEIILKMVTANSKISAESYAAILTGKALSFKTEEHSSGDPSRRRAV